MAFTFPFDPKSVQHIDLQYGCSSKALICLEAAATSFMYITCKYIYRILKTMLMFNMSPIKLSRGKFVRII